MYELIKITEQWYSSRLSPCQNRGFRPGGRGVPRSTPAGTRDAGRQGAQGARRAGLEAAGHTRHALERRPHRRLPVSAAADRVPAFSRRASRRSSRARRCSSRASCTAGTRPKPLRHKFLMAQPLRVRGRDGPGVPGRRCSVLRPCRATSGTKSPATSCRTARPSSPTASRAPATLGQVRLPLRLRRRRRIWIRWTSLAPA